MKIILTLLSLILLNSCQVAPDINRVSGGYIDKKDLDGEWYFGSTIVDKQFHNASTFIGAECRSEKVRFELTENMLFAYRSYENVLGTEGSKAGSQNLIAAFPIDSHFDIRRKYNTANGVESNEIIENDFDRSWQQREFVRIDWSKNIAPDTECGDWFKAESYARSNHEASPREPFKTRISKDYIETTHEALIRPSEHACEAIGEWKCAASIAKMKLSFSRVKETNYKPKSYPDQIPLEYGLKDKVICVRGEEGCENLQVLWTYAGPNGTEICNPAKHNIDECKKQEVSVFSRFGYFRTERYHFDREQGFTLTGRQQLINRWNIWEDEKEKIPKPIIYYLNVGFPEDLYEASQEIASDWSQAFAQTVASLQKNNVTAEQIEEEYGKLFQIKKNSCNIKDANNFADKYDLHKSLSKNGVDKISAGNLEEACAVLEWESKSLDLGTIFSWEQLGDVRYSLLNYSNKAELAGPLGYGPSFADPVTGEIIQGSAHIYGASIEIFAARGADIVFAMNNNLDIDTLARDNKKASYVKTAKKFEKLIKDRTVNLGEDIYLLKIPENSPSNWELLEELKLEERYLSEELKPSIWEKNENSLEKKITFFENKNACYLSEMLEPQILDLANQLKNKSWMEVHRHIKSAVFKAVASHEIGHTLGLRHNFAGSFDALNFFADFWDPKKSHKSEMKYSSIMDYHQRFNSDFSGIGLYDKAAIKFGYGNLIEVFDESEEEFVPKTWHDNAKLFHYTDLPYLYAGGDVNDKLKAHYLEVKSDFKKGLNTKINIKSLSGAVSKPENLYKRKDVDFNTYYVNHAKQLFGQKEEPLFDVPYQYCSDAYANGGGLNCSRWDMGASVEEIVDNAAEMYDSYYWLNSFRRDKIKITPQSYMARTYSRTYKPMLEPFRYLYRYQRTSLSIWPLVQDWSLAAYKGLNFFGKVLQSVEPGKYCLGENNTYILEGTSENCESPIEIGLDQGKYFDTHYTESSFYKANNIGHMYDKLLAMVALTDSKAYFMRDFSDMYNRGAFSIGYYRVFAPEMIKLFTDQLLDNKDENSPYIDIREGQAKIVYKPIVNIEDLKVAEEKIDLPKIRSTNSWSLRYYALLLPMINFTSPVDGQLDYVKRARVTLVGSKHDPVNSEGFKQIIYEDPISKLRYRSVVIGSEDLSPGYLILKEASNYVATTDIEQRDRGVFERANFIDLLRKVGDAFEAGI